MPVILPPERFDAWLDPAETDDDRLRGLLRPAPDEDLEIHQVSRLVNSPANDEPACIEPIDEPIDDAAGEPDEPDEPTLFG
jgi:putative SOS response-associated peptidase YedK